jgi:hypothetical protein
MTAEGPIMPPMYEYISAASKLQNVQCGSAGDRTEHTRRNVGTMLEIIELMGPSESARRHLCFAARRAGGSAGALITMAGDVSAMAPDAHPSVRQARSVVPARTSNPQWRARSRKI